jgi:flotillin
MLIEVLPQIAKEVAAPIGAIDQLTVISTDGAGALPRQVTDNVVQTLSMLKTTTGLDLEALIKRAVEGAVTGLGPTVPVDQPASVVPGQSTKA